MIMRIQHFRLYINGSANGLSGDMKWFVVDTHQVGIMPSIRLFTNGILEFVMMVDHLIQTLVQFASWTENKTIFLQTRAYNGVQHHQEDFIIPIIIMVGVVINLINLMLK